MFRKTYQHLKCLSKDHSHMGTNLRKLFWKFRGFYATFARIMASKCLDYMLRPFFCKSGIKSPVFKIFKKASINLYKNGRSWCVWLEISQNVNFVHFFIRDPTKIATFKMRWLLIGKLILTLRKYLCSASWRSFK